MFERLRFRPLITIALTTLVFAGCAPRSTTPDSATPDSATPPPRGLSAALPPRGLSAAPPPQTPGNLVAAESLPLAILPDGTTVKLELAITPEEIPRGLMFRPALPEDRGMLFLFDEPAPKQFWMKNTYVALDIIFLDGSGKVLAISDNAQPCPAEPCPKYNSGQPVAAALELIAGAASRHGVVEGASIDFRNVANYPVQEEGP